MGFSLSRALQGATMGAANAAGEIFDDMIKEERKQREAVEAQGRAKEMATLQADLIMDRERRRDEDKEKLAERNQEKIKQKLGGYYAAAREEGLDPNDMKGMRFIANKALEAGDVGVYDKMTDNIDRREKNLADAENKKLQIEAIRAQRDANHAAKMDAEDRNAMQSIVRQADRLVIPGARDDSGKVIGDPDKDAANAALAWAEDQREQGRSWKAIRSDLAQITDGFVRQPEELKKSPSINRFTAALDFWNLPEEEKAKLRAPKTGVLNNAGAAPPAGTKKPDTGGGLWGAIKGTIGQAGQNMQGTADALSVGNGD